ncbi:precorrin-2 C20-methyltransferase [Desulfurispirillum indicum S5]|uniref:Precorrin-2 C20-methyltransferase n=1 Tax=Desulfurispirillum indicum (strain ATCC BAA-1389 / DSM 22839 / S5) TaxID=653733 RepID=E6W0S0_DESIS|nr:precorrin-2 C(20)-methyltransferase [Desulfurispirillum indicum]ADU66415.1 precorrin-2 C20-methyltransferase [Desulfurispirillum indicum S5]
MTAKICGIGLGPGDPELVTIKAVRAMEQADMVVVPQSDITGRSIAADIVSRYIPAEKIHMYHFPMTGNKADLDTRYSALADEMARWAATGKRVCYVTIGDTPVYSTFNYLRDKLLAQGIATEMVPGVSAYSAAANSQSLPLCEKDGSFCVIEMPETLDELPALLERFSSVVLMKVHKRLPALCQFVRQADLAYASLFQRITLPEEQVYDLLTQTPPQDAGYLSTAILQRREFR